MAVAAMEAAVGMEAAVAVVVEVAVAAVANPSAISFEQSSKILRGVCVPGWVFDESIGDWSIK